MADDREVWSKIIQQDEAAFDAFYQEHAPRLHAFLRALVGDRQAAEDVAQETFLQIWTRPNGYEPERGALRAYLFGIGRKRAAEWWRQQKTTEPLLQERNGWCGTEKNALILDALHSLSEEQRTLLWLREIEGQSYAELAMILEIPVGTVRSRLFAAREALRRVWQMGQSAAEKRRV
ncbi:MAG TPA: RNA polymerase sigma factor [Acidobacteriaceae bacterium]